MIRFPPSTTT